MRVERTYEGESRNENLQEAIAMAPQRLDADLGEGGVSDGSASWTITQTSGTRGGFTGSLSIKVKITAKRSPPWDA